VEILDLRHFGSSDLRPLLDEESHIWLKNLVWDYSSSAEMILRYVDSKILPGYAALERGRILGYCFFVYEGPKGVIGDIFVDPVLGSRRQAVEHQLLGHVADTLQESPGVNRVEAQLLLHPAGSASQPFLERGFRCYPRLFMRMPINDHAWSGKPLANEIEIRPWQEHDYQPAAAIITAAYRGHIDSEINDQYRSITGSLRFLNNIVRFPGCGYFDSGSSLVAYHKPTHSNVGIILCSRVKPDVAHITQVCLAPQFRNMGIGEHMIRESHDRLKQRGFTDVTLTVTEANAGAVALYERLGFSIERAFDAFVWEE
jgi:ribosomal protein S18 acetylase RimI-like enzyme